MSDWNGPMKDDTLEQLVKSLDSRFPSDRRMAGFEMYRRLRELVPLLERIQSFAVLDGQGSIIEAADQALALAKGGEKR